MSNPENIKPCPFCGSDNLFIIPRFYDNSVTCLDCDACGPDAPEDDDGSAWELWNKRAIISKDGE